MKRKKAYIAGKISGLAIEEYYGRFGQAESIVEDMGYSAINPLKIVPQWLEYEDQMSICITLVDISDVVYMINNWWDSSGAKREHTRALELGKTIVYQND